VRPAFDPDRSDRCVLRRKALRWSVARAMRTFQALVLATSIAGVASACATVDGDPATPDGNPVRCHLTAAGETHIVSSAFSAAVYEDIPLKVGSAFLFRIVAGRDSTGSGSIRLYAYAARKEGPSLIQQVRFRYPPPSASQFGFTGLQSVYESEWESELQYWCELRQRSSAGESPSGPGTRQP